MCVCAHEFIPDGRNSMCEGPGAGDSWTIQGTDGGSGGNRLVLMWGHQEEFTLNKGSMELFAFPECVCLCVYVCVCVYTCKWQGKEGSRGHEEKELGSPWYPDGHLAGE